MSRWIDADIYVTATLYDDEHEEYRDERMTIADCLDRFTDEGCPTKVEPKQGEWIFKTVFPNDKSEFPMGYLVCSVCGSHHSNSVPCNYCDNCGCRMKGADDE
jgi:hypothetical protein